MEVKYKNYVVEFDVEEDNGKYSTTIVLPISGREENLEAESLEELTKEVRKQCITDDFAVRLNNRGMSEDDIRRMKIMKEEVDIQKEIEGSGEELELDDIEEEEESREGESIGEVEDVKKVEKEIEVEDTHKPYEDLMIDLETLGIEPGSIIVQIGAVGFDLEGGEESIGESLNIKIDIGSSLVEGFKTNQNTLNWWSEASQEAKEMVFSGDKVSIREALTKLSEFIQNRCSQSVKVWGNGSFFDISLLEFAYRKLDMTIPWEYYNVRDMRTIMDTRVCKSSGCLAFTGIRHYAVDDCKYQIREVLVAFENISK